MGRALNRAAPGVSHGVRRGAEHDRSVIAASSPLYTSPRALLSTAILTVALPALCLSLLFTPERSLAAPRESAEAGPFRQGSARLGAGLGSAHPYIVFGLGLGYYVADGVELGLAGDIWFGDSPKIYQVIPQARYVFYQLPMLSPYLGALYREVIIEGETEGWRSVGARAGVIYWGNGRLLIGGGWVVERLLDCEGSHCERQAPELQLQVSF